MPRSSSAPRSSRPLHRPTPAPTIAHHQPVAVHHTGPTLGQTIKEGFGFGVGNAIAQRVVTGFFGAPKIAVTAVPTAYEQCIAEHRDDVALCAHLAEKKSQGQ